MTAHRCAAWRLDEIANCWVCMDCGSPEAPRWETPVRGAKGQVTRDPEGVLYLEVQLGGAWWSLPAHGAMATALAVAIEATRAAVAKEKGKKPAGVEE